MLESIGLVRYLRSLGSRFLPLVLCFALIPPAAWGQRYNIRTYTENDGLPSPRVLDIAQDPRGRMWFLTHLGITVYDGSEWESYRSLEGLLSGEYFGFEIAWDGKVWIVERTGDLELMVFGDGSWSLKPGPEGLTDATVTSFAVASDSSGPMAAIGTLGDGLWVLDHDHWYHYGAAEGLVQNRVNALLSLGERLLVASEDGLCELILGKLECGKEVPGVPPGRLLAMAIRPTAATSPSEEEVWFLGPGWVSPPVESGFKTVFLEGMELEGGQFFFGVGPLGTAVVGMSTRIDYAEPGSHEMHSLGPIHGTLGKGATSLLFDREGTMWIANVRGLSKIVDRRFATFRQEHGLVENEVSSLAILPSGHLVFGHNYGLTLFDGENFEAREFTRIDTSIMRIMDMSLDKNGVLWMAGSALGLGSMTDEGPVHWLGPEEGVLGTVHAVLVDGDEIWVGGVMGLYRGRPGDFRPVDVGTQISVRRIYRGALGKLFVATTESGVYWTEGDGWLRAFHPTDSRANSTYTLLETDALRNREETLVGSAVGLFRIEDEVLVPVEEGRLQINRPVYFLLEEHDGTLWVGTDNGVLRWNSGNLSHFTTLDGLAGNETNRAAGIVDARGRVWIGTGQGVSRYHEELEPRINPPPSIDQLFVDAAGSRLPLDENIELPASSNSLNFHFKAISFIDEARISYRTRLEGFDHDWLATVTHSGNGMRYTNLPPGKYRYLVQARNVRSDWSPVEASATIVIEPPFWRQGWFLVVIGIILLTLGLIFERIITARRRAILFDRLTGLPNRTLFLRYVDRALKSRSKSTAVLLLDLDRLPHVNESLGHQQGDVLLRTTARRLRETVGSKAKISSVGGSKFSVLLDEISDPEEINATAMRVHQALERPMTLRGLELFSSATMGIAIASEGDYQPEHLLRDAQSAMNRAKVRGPGSFMTFESSMRDQAINSLGLEAQLRHAIEKEELAVFYQPIVALDSEELIGFEALVRWHHEDRGLLLPHSFLPLAHETGLIVDIDGWVLREACRQRSEWMRMDRVKEEFAVSVNVASYQFLDSKLVESIAEVLQEFKLPPATLKLEIVENLLMQQTGSVIDVLQRLRALEIGILIDDFGTGYSSLSYLQKFPVDALKIDRSFVNALQPGSDEAEIIRTIVGLGHHLGLSVLAEGIESAEQQDQLREIGCDSGQGFLYSVPLSAADATDLIRSQ